MIMLTGALDTLWMFWIIPHMQFFPPVNDVEFIMNLYIIGLALYKLHRDLKNKCGLIMCFFEQHEINIMDFVNDEHNIFFIPNIYKWQLWQNIG